MAIDEKKKSELPRFDNLPGENVQWGVAMPHPELGSVYVLNPARAPKTTPTK